jgi:hypothetical protein
MKDFTVLYLPLNLSGAAFVSGRGIVRIEFPGTVRFTIVDWMIVGFWDEILVKVAGDSKSK